MDFSDNDFRMTMKGFLSLFKDSFLVEMYPESVTKQNISKFWEESKIGIYLITQHHFSGCNPTKGETEEELQKNLDNLRNYLVLKDNHIYFGQECLDRIIEDNNGEFCYIDTDSGEIYSS